VQAKAITDRANPPPSPDGVRLPKGGSAQNPLSATNGKEGGPAGPGDLSPPAA